MKTAATLPPPGRPGNLSENAKWLAGEGAGSWFVIEPLNACYRVKRFSPTGNLECEGDFFNTVETPFDATMEFEMTYLSHCEQVTVRQNKQLIVLRNIHQSKHFSRQP